MGSIYRPKYKNAKGDLVESAVWWLSYYSAGKQVRESSRTTKESKARGLLRAKEGDAERGLPVVKVNRKTVSELLDDVVTDYKNHDRKTTKKAGERIRLHLRPFFGALNAAQVSDDRVRTYITQRKAEGAANATINRELSLLKRGYSLNERAVTVRPIIEDQEENNVREGFFERVRAALPPEYRPLLTVAYITGWRTQSELLPMESRQVDFAAGTMRLEPGTTKNKKGREFPFALDEELEAALLEQRAYTEACQRKAGAIIPYVFHRKGKRIRDWRGRWLRALLKVGLAHREVGEDGQPKKGGKIIPHVIRHDLRRTGIRNLSRAGVSEAVAMRLCGHETRSVFDRYNVVTGDDLREAVAKLNAAKTATIKVSSKVAVVGERDA
jgi:site-specific recombinase XerD